MEAVFLNNFSSRGPNQADLQNYKISRKEILTPILPIKQRKQKAKPSECKFLSLTELRPSDLQKQDF